MDGRQKLLHLRIFGMGSAVIVLAALGVVAIPAASAAAVTPPVSGCPAGYQVLAVSTLTALGYQVPAVVDDPVNGGNGDGTVCGKPINPTRTAQLCGTPCDVPVLYKFRDNTLTPSH